MADDPTTPPREPSQEGEGPSTGEPPPFEPDPELIGYWEEAKKSAPKRR